MVCYILIRRMIVVASIVFSIFSSAFSLALRMEVDGSGDGGINSADVMAYDGVRFYVYLEGGAEAGNDLSIDVFTANAYLLAETLRLTDSDISRGRVVRTLDKSVLPSGAWIEFRSSKTKSSEFPAVSSGAIRVIVDTISPVLTEVGVPSDRTNNDAFTATFRFNEDVKNFSIDDITIVGATLSSFSGNGGTYSVRVKPTGDHNVTISMAANRVVDLVGNTGSVSVVQKINVWVDNVRPTVVISDVPGHSHSPFTATVTFSEDVTDFIQTDIAVVGAILSDFAGSGSTYTVLVTPTAAAVTLNIAADVANDVASNGNVAAQQAASAFDANHPALDILDVPLHSNAPFVATFQFNEGVTGFIQGDITVAGASLSNFTIVDAATYTVLVKPTAAIVTLSVAAEVATDFSGHKNTASDEKRSAFDDVKPTLKIDIPLHSNAAFVATFTFSEHVQGFTAADIDLGNATKGAFVTVSESVYTLVVNPTGSDVTVDVQANTAMDAASNSNVAADQASSAFDDDRPTIVISDVPGHSHSSFTATFTFSEDVGGFTQDDITAVGRDVKSF